MKDMRKRMARTDTTKATTMPVRRTAPSVAVKWRPKSSSLTALAPIIIGTASRKVNSAAATRDTPIIRAPIIVEPERDVPGNTAAMSWKKPIHRAAL